MANDSLKAKMEALGLDTSVLEAGNLPSVQALASAQDNPFEFIGPGYDPDLGRWAQVFTDQDVKNMKAIGYQVVTSGVSVKGVPGGHILLRPAPIEARYSAARKVRDARERNGRTTDADRMGPAEMKRSTSTRTG